MVINPHLTSCQIEACHHQVTDQAHQIQNIDKYGISRGFYKETLTDVCWQYDHLPLSHTMHIHKLVYIEGGGQNAKEICKKLFVKP